MDKFRITVFQNRKKPVGRVREFTWEELVEKLSDPVITDDTMEEYAAMTNEERTNIKDVGGYVGGECRGGRRSQATVMNRCLLTIDADDATPNAVEDFMSGNLAVFLCHTTHSSTVESPRLRWVFPLSRPVTGDEYRILVRIVKEWVGAESIDETTDQPERLMFWPSIGLDTQWDVWTGGTTMVDVDSLLEDTDIPESPAPVTEKAPADDDFVVSEGQRNKTLFGFAASLRGNGLNRDDILAMLSVYNENHCDPPMPDSELETITRSVCGRYAPGDHVMPTLRDAYDDFSDLGKVVERQTPVGIRGESFASLCSRDIKAPKFVIDNLITTGITILASPPKFGKSWMSLDMCLSVATGTEFMGMGTTKSGVIYLALEDGDYRLKERGLKVNGGRPIPTNLLLVKQAPILENGLLKDLQKVISESPSHVGLIVIDTLQKIRGTAKKNEGVYGYDYRELGDLHQFALDQDIAVVLVHHLNKGKDDGTDSVARINGSTGVSGAADTIITLTRNKRTDSETRMEITGRDVRSRTLVIMFDDLAHRWIYLGDEKEVANNRDRLEFDTDPMVKTVVHMLDMAEDIGEDVGDQVVWRVSSKGFADEVRHVTGTETDSPARLGRKLKGLCDKLREYEQITVEFSHTRSGNEYVFTRPTAT